MAVFRFILLTFLLLGIIDTSSAGPDFDFEVSSEINSFEPRGTHRNSRRSIVPDHSKSGKKSLLWEWDAKSNPTDADPSLTLKLDATTTITGSELKNGGIKFWMYRVRETPDTKMNIVFQDYDRSTSTVTKETPAVDVNLNFKGWRAVWIGYKEFGLEDTQLNQLNRVKFTITTNDDDKLYIDLLRLARQVGKQTRDQVVPEVPMIGMGSPRDYNTHPLLYDDKNYWQQSLRWDKCTRCQSTPNPGDVPDAGLDAKINEIDDIEDRLDNWYAKTGVSLTYLITAPPGSCESFKKRRWNSLKRSITDAHDLYAKLSLDATNKIIGPPLFSKISKLGRDEIVPNGKTNFGFIFTEILFPLSLEYSLMNRDDEVKSLADNECLKLKRTGPPFQKAITKIAGKLKSEFETMLNAERAADSTFLDCTTASKTKVKNLIKTFNDDVRFDRILRLLNYLENEGWAAGSGLGTSDHEMNKAGAGFMHSMFLLRHKLRDDSILLARLLKTMKWYTDFNEIYQLPGQYTYDGTTADRMRTILVYRLMIILIPSRPTPTMTIDRKQKVYDMIRFKSWFENALKINKGLGGVIKPDFTGFHHMTFYGSAYVPHALHIAAFVKYLLGDGSNFALDSTSSENLRKALGVLRIVSVKYSTPNGICGRFPNYQKKILAETFPAYAYMSYIHHTTPDLHREDAEIFLRLFDLTDSAIQKFLSNGRIGTSIYYLNSIGSIDILCKVKSLATTKGFSAEASPSGHWSKNFAALSIHRRDDWSVAAKGFSQYTWDFENGPKENLYGLFQSYGSLQISNSEDELKRYDVSEGWDWTKVPGATTFNIGLPDMKTNKARYYSLNGGFAGGVSLKGKNGMFGMLLNELPRYDFISPPPATMDFSFRKSYLFYKGLIVCVGDGITLTTASGLHAQTTLFQDKRLSSADKINLDGTVHDLGTDYDKNTWPGRPAEATLKDTNDNTYVIKRPFKSGLKIKISDQHSKTRDGGSSNARYATAWLEHSSTPKNYEYAIVIKGNPLNLVTKYTVRKKRGAVHAIDVQGRGEITVGYSVFSVSSGSQRMPSRSKGPVRSVNKPCLMMTNEKGTTLYLAISDPSFKFKDVPSPSIPQTCSRKSWKDFEWNGSRFVPKTDYLNPAIVGDVRAKLLFCVEGDENSIRVTLKKDVTRIRSVKVNGEDKTAEKDTYVTFDPRIPRELTFLNLVNGFTTELKLEIV